VWLFYLTTIFAVAYMAYYHVLKVGDLQIAAYRKDAQMGEQIKNASIAKFEGRPGNAFTRAGRADAWQRTGRLRADVRPVPPSLTAGGWLDQTLCDDHWIHGSNYVDNLKVIINGVPEKGMLTWRGVLKPSEIQAVASYIYGFRGTAPLNPKLPENQQQPDKPNQYE
jgi:cytochrome c oxidase cbb3-type subunit 3